MRKIIHYLLIHVMVLAVHFPGDEEVMIGVELFYNYKTEEAVEILAQARKNFSENSGASPASSASFRNRLICSCSRSGSAGGIADSALY